MEKAVDKISYKNCEIEVFIDDPGQCYYFKGIDNDTGKTFEGSCGSYNTLYKEEIFDYIDHCLGKKGRVCLYLYPNVTKTIPGWEKVFFYNDADIKNSLSRVKKFQDSGKNVMIFLNDSSYEAMKNSDIDFFYCLYHESDIEELKSKIEKEGSPKGPVVDIFCEFTRAYNEILEKEETKKIVRFLRVWEPLEDVLQPIEE